MIRRVPIKADENRALRLTLQLVEDVHQHCGLAPRMHRESTVGDTRTVVDSVRSGKFLWTASTQAFTQGASCTKLLGLTMIPGRVHAAMSKVFGSDLLGMS